MRIAHNYLFLCLTTTQSNSSVAGWAIDQRVGNPVPEIILSDCDEVSHGGIMKTHGSSLLLPPSHLINLL